MSRFTDYLDRRFYPGVDESWDVERFRAYLGDVLGPDDVVLDLGAGRGAVSQLDLRDAVSRVVGVDLSPAVHGNPWLHEAGLMESDGTIPYDDGSFDVVLTHNVLEHVEDPGRLFQEVSRVLRPGGLFISKTPNRLHYVALIARTTPHRFHEFINRRRDIQASDTFRTYYRCNDARAVRRNASAAGFAVESIEMWEGRPSYARIWSALYPMGIAYERVVNRLSWTSGLRCMMVLTLRKVSRDG
jgi:SAM-dependent methyltransferase